MRRAFLALPVLFFLAGCHGANLEKATLPAAGPWVVARLRVDPAHLSQQVHSLARQAAQRHKRLLLFFGAPWCHPCQVVTRVFQTPANRALLSGWYLVHVDVDKLPPGPPLGIPFEGIPFFVKLGPGGKVAGTLGARALGSAGRAAQMDAAFARFLRA